MFEAKYPGNEFDRAMWKQFWFRTQKYHTICLPCISADKERERNAENMHDPDLDWGAVMLQKAGKSIISTWHQNARSNLDGPEGTANVDISDDDEEEDVAFNWTKECIVLNEKSSIVATMWLRTARARLQARSNRRMRFK